MSMTMMHDALAPPAPASKQTIASSIQHPIMETKSKETDRYEQKNKPTGKKTGNKGL